MSTVRLAILASVAAATFSARPAAAAIVLEGNFIRVGISDYGTLGSNGNASPGLIHDPSGSGSFDPSTDYVNPGTPHEGFSLISDQFAFMQNDNTLIGGFGVAGPELLAGAAALGFANAATWSGTNGFLNITNSYFFNDGDERINIFTTITALTDLTNLAFARSVDPDSGGTSSANQRGNSLFAAKDFVGSESTINGRTLALVNLNGDLFENNTQINSNCCSNINPYSVLAGGGLGNASTGDHGLNLAYRIGSLAAGSSATINYAYAVGDNIDIVGSPSAVPEPATWAMMLIGFGAVGYSMRKRTNPRLVQAV